MILLVDVGNTRIKWSLGVSERCCAGAFERRSPDWDAEHLVAAISSATMSSSITGVIVPTEVWVASVASIEFQDYLAQSVAKVWGCVLRFAAVQPGLLGLQLAYQDAQQLGVDRWLVMLAAQHRAKGKAVVVVDAGSAITVDYLGSSGRHLGGLIAPGVRMMQRALFSDTARVKVKPLTLPQTWRPGKDTLSCVEQGVATMLRGFYSQLNSDVNSLGCEFEQAVWFVTGGDAVLFSGQQSLNAVVVEDLVLVGLSLWGLANSDCSSPRA